MAEMEINKNVDEIMTKANTLIEALPYIRRFNGATIIVTVSYTHLTLPTNSRV